ncbi:polysaccharide lyase family 7 protein [Flammeovirga pectinis]|uniref:Polysaccharide lyase family 7 protein n=1 Tax=Flammeovirga pectinis TaxID=2494373 RepID=A0A3S9P3H6_9BACT|nr:polysaccharide lyase family 7 protein [Flammeovirga pectinis]AZQ62755.1 polysaccharide lyase family 7 protein [Flammeovirga pectinis]
MKYSTTIKSFFKIAFLLWMTLAGIGFSCGCNQIEDEKTPVVEEEIEADNPDDTTSDDKETEEEEESSDNEEEEENNEESNFPYPFEILNLQNWKLNAFTGTLNTPVYEDQISNLSTYENENWFFTEDGQSVAFKCYGGYPTSSGSGNPRTELREMTANGSSTLNWDGTKGTNRMEWKVKVDQLPSSGKACFGQIHGRSSDFDDVIRIQFQGDDNQSEGGVRLKIMGWVTEENDDKEGDYLDGDWKLDEEYHFELIFEDSNVWVNQIDESGEKKEIYRFEGCASDYNYFKAGIYLQSMQNKPFDLNDYGQVSISYLNISH